MLGWDFIYYIITKSSRFINNIKKLILIEKVIKKFWYYIKYK